MKKLIITMTALGLLLGAAQGQNGPGPGGPPADFPQGPPEFVADVPEEILTLRAEIKALRDELTASREALLKEIDETATREEKRAAIQQWNETHRASMANLRELSEELRAMIHENRPGGPPMDIPEDILDMRADLRDQRQALADSRRVALAAIGENPTDEDVRAAIEAWRAANADAIAEVQALADELRTWFQDNRPERPGRAFTPGMAERRADFRANLASMKENRMAFSEKMRDPNLDPEMRHALIQEFREQNRELMQERKALMRQQRIDQGGVGGDRRPGG